MNDQSLQTVRTALSGYELLNDPLLNKGTAFTEAERDEFELHGLLPPHVATLDDQCSAGSTPSASSAATSPNTSSCAACRTPTRPCSTRC